MRARGAPVAVLVEQRVGRLAAEARGHQLLGVREGPAPDLVRVKVRVRVRVRV